MAYIKMGMCDSLKFIEKNSDRFDYTFTPDQRTMYAGIYRCKGCGLEILYSADTKLPPYDPPHHSHEFGEGEIE